MTKDRLHGRNHLAKPSAVRGLRTEHDIAQLIEQVLVDLLACNAPATKAIQALEDPADPVASVIGSRTLEVGEHGLGKRAA